MKTYVSSIVIVLWVGLLIGLWQATVFDWWFEDDAVLYALAAKVSNPLLFFVDKNSIVPVDSDNHNEIVPMLWLSFWIDSKILARSTTLCYLHSGLSFLLTTLFLFYALCYLFKERVALCVTLLWTILPSTVVVNEFLSTRCYMEGLLWSLLSLHLVLKLANGSLKTGIVNLTLLVVVAIAAVLSKEFYPTALLALAFLIALYQRNYPCATAMVFVGAFYATYRIWVVGASLNYDNIPHLEPREYFAFLARLPYIFAGNYGGYVLFVVPVLWACASQLLRSAKRCRLNPSTALLFIVTLISLATIYPVSAPVSAEWLSHGTWYRSVFIVNTCLLIFGTQAVIAINNRALNYTSFAIAASVVAFGAAETISHWDLMKTRYQQEGHFAVDGPPGLLYSRLPAKWYLPGLVQLYPEAINRVFIDKKSLKNDSTLPTLLRYDTVWSFNDKTQSVERDDKLYNQLRARLTKTEKSAK